MVCRGVGGGERGWGGWCVEGGEWWCIGGWERGV